MLCLKSCQLDGVERLSGKSRETGENALLWLALEITNATNRAIVFARKIVQDDTGPLSWSKFGLTDELDHPRFDTVDVDALADDETVRVGRQDYTSICERCKKGFSSGG